jgi:hypothetical protein
MLVRSLWLVALLALCACEIRPIAPLAAHSLLIQGRGTEVRLAGVLFSKLQRSELLDFATQTLVNDRQVSGHLAFEIDTASAVPSVRVVGQDITGRTVFLKSLGALDYASVTLDTVPPEAGMTRMVSGVKVNDVLLFKVSDDHRGEEYGKLVIRKATSLVVGFDYALQTDGQNVREVCPTPSPSAS